MVILKLAFGLIFLFLGYIYIYYPNLVLDINRLFREKLFSDRLVLIARKKLAILYFCIAAVFLYMGVTSLARTMEKSSSQSWLIDKARYSMYLATQDYYSGRYERAVSRYLNVLPTLRNINDKKQVLKRLAFTYSAMGDKKSASKILERLSKIDPNTQDLKTKLAVPAEKKSEDIRHN